MIKRNGYFLAAILFGFSFMTACSKNLMPPDGLDGSSASVDSQMNRSGDPQAGGAGRGFGIQEESSGFLSEENVGESARPGDFSSGRPGDFSSGNSNNGDRFQSDTEPFLGDSYNGRDEARRQNFKPTSNLKDINFKFDKFDLDEQSRRTLRQNASYLKSNLGTIIEIQGHADERGTNNYNIALGERRAQSTKMYLVQQGISARRIHTISYGEEKPLCFDSNDSCWFNNRRAHFRVSE